MLGHCINSDGSDFVLPDPEGQNACLRGALASAGLEPGEIDLVSTHATSTPSGDLAESRAMREVFGDDAGRIDHAAQVLGYAERIQAAEGGDALVVRAAAILHDIGIREAERKYDSSGAHYQEIEGPPIARGILEKLCLNTEVIDHVCTIVATHHSAGVIDTTEFRAIWDADALVNLAEVMPKQAPEQRGDLIERTFRTDTGRTIAQRIFLESA